MRDLLLLGVTLGSLPFILRRPFLGLVVFSWLAYMRPHDMTWGLSSSRLSLLVAVATLAGLAIAAGRERALVVRPLTLLMIALGVWVGVTTLTALEPSLAQERFVLLAKILLISVLTTGLVTDHKRFRALFLTISFSLGFLGLKYALYGLARGGVRLVQGPGGFMVDNNAFALALNMGIAMLAGVALTEERRWVRWAAVGLAGACALAVIFTFSRGGLLALAVLLVLLVVRSGRPLLLLVLLAGLLILTPVYVSDSFQASYLDRASSISEYQEDDSSMGRLHEWKVALEIFQDYPVFGVGPNNLRVVHGIYSPGSAYFRVTHNSFLQILVWSGLPGLVLYLAILGVSLVRLSRMRRSVASRRLSAYAGALQLALIANIVAGVFLDMCAFDLTYHLVGMTVALEGVALAQARKSQEPDRRGLPPPTEVPWWLRKPISPGETS